MTPYTDNQNPSPSPLVSFGRSLLSFNRGQVHTMDLNNNPNPHDLGLESFQNSISERFQRLSIADPDEFLSLEWIHKLLDVFVICQDEFRVILLDNKARASKPPMERLVSDYFVRTVKALDILNATRDGIGKIKLWEKHLEIVNLALDSRKRAGESQFHRARKALGDLALEMLDEDESNGSVFSTYRNRSFGCRCSSKDSNNQRSSGHARSRSWSVSRTWSASKQIQFISNGLIAPRGNEILATNGLSAVVFSISFVLMFVLWVVVAAFPLQDRGIQTHFTIPRNFVWAGPFSVIHDRIVEESKKRRHSNGILKEIREMEKCVRESTELVDSCHFHVSEDARNEAGKRSIEILEICEEMKKRLEPFELQVRDVFRRIVSFRSEGLEILNNVNLSVVDRV